MSVSLPSPPLRVSSPASPMRLSLPSSPMRLSLPVPPYKLSLPLPPYRLSLPARPKMASSPNPPFIALFVASPTTASSCAVPTPVNPFTPLTKIPLILNASITSWVGGVVSSKLARRCQPFQVVSFNMFLVAALKSIKSIVPCVASAAIFASKLAFTAVKSKLIPLASITRLIWSNTGLNRVCSAKAS